MPFRSFKFGDSIINTKRVLAAQSPWWYQLKTASFRVGTSHAAAFSPLFFLFTAYLFHGNGGPSTTIHLCHAPAPRHEFLGQRGNTLLSTIAVQFLYPLGSPSSIQTRAMAFKNSISSCRHAGIGSIAWIAPNRKLCGVPSLPAVAPGCHCTLFCQFHG